MVDDPLGKYPKSLKSNWLGFPWLFPKIISMLVSMKTKPTYLYYFLSTCYGPFFFFYYWAPFVTYCWLFPQSQALVFLVTLIEGWSSLVISSWRNVISTLGFFISRSTIQLLEKKRGPPFTWYVILNLLVFYKWAWLSSFDYVRLWMCWVKLSITN